MDELRRQVAIAHRRLWLNQFLSLVGWTLFAALLVAAVAVAVPRLWILPVTRSVWDASWIAGAAALGIAAAWFLMGWRGRGTLEAAIEIDRRFGLKERISSTLLLTPDERTSEAGEALVKDAQRRAAQLAVAEKFQIAPSWRLLLPLPPVLAALILALFCEVLVPESSAKAQEEQAAETAQVRQATELLKKKVERQAAEAEQMGLKDAQDLFDKLEKHLNEVSKKEHIDRKEATLKLNDLAREIENRRGELSPTENLKKQLNQLNKLEQGPADKMAKALKDGDFEKAAEELKGLQDKLENNELTAEEKEKLAQQLAQAEQKLKDLANRQEEIRQNLKEQIAQKQAQGDQAGAKKLEQQLEQLNDQQPQMDALNDLAEQLGQAGQSLKDGNPQQAAQQLQRLQQQAQQMQNDVDQMQQLDELLDQVADAQKAMNCEQCQGQGCKKCQGGNRPGQGDADELLDEPGDSLAQNSGQGGQGQKPGPGNGLGQGPGQGARPEEKTDHKTFDSNVAGQVQKGAATITGKVSGPNLAGNSRLEIEEAVRSVKSAEADPLTDQAIPRHQRDHARQYFEKLREGK